MSTIYVNNSGTYGETVIFTDSDRADLYAGMREAFGDEFDLDGFDNLTFSIELPRAMNRTQDDHGDDWQWLITAWHTNRATFMDGAAAICEAALDTWQALTAIMTTNEIADEYGIADATVRQAIQRGDIPARQSGSTWLIHRAQAEARWGHRR